jgi:hypothetical protein
MTAGQRRWTRSDQTRLEAALRLDARENPDLIVDPTSLDRRQSIA